MNRSILIVICDFLVSSMLSMMTGMIPANSSGNGIGLDADSTRILIVELERSRSELLQLRNALRANIERNGETPENQAKMDELIQKLAQNELELEKLQALKKNTPENTGTLSRDELEKRLEAEKRRRIEAEIREQEKSESVTMVRSMLKEAQSALQQSRENEAQLRYDVNRANSSLNEITLENAKKAETLARTQEVLSQTEKELVNSRQNLTQTQTALEHTRTQNIRLQTELTASQKSAAEVKAAAEKTKIELVKTQAEQSRKAEALTRTQAALSQTEKALADSRQNLTQTQTALEQTRMQNTRLQTQLTASQKSAADNKAAAENSKTELTKTKTTLALTEQQLKERQEQVQLTLRRNTENEGELNRLRGQNAATAKELAEMKDKAGKLERELEQQKILQRDAENARKEAEKFSKTAAIELVAKGTAAKKAEEALADTRKKLVDTEKEKEVAQQKLQFLQKQTDTNLFEHYQKSVVKLSVEITEERTFKDYGSTNIHYLPLVTIGQKNYLIGALPMFAGGEETPYHYQKVKKLAFVLAGAKIAQMPISMSLLISKKEPYLAAFTLPNLPGVTPLQCIQANELCKRGVKNLTLFKTSSCGKDSMALGDRCSLDLQPGASALIIRNNARSATEIKAQVGDFILTNNGEFVGVVVSISDAGRQQEARVALCDDTTWQNADKVSLDVDITDHYYHQFGDYMKKHIKR